MPTTVDDEGLYDSFEAIRLYDAPGVLMKQILDDELTYRSFKDLFTDSASLSPAERDSITDGLKESLGGSAVGNTLVDVATNPFTWLLFLTSPGATNALKRGGAIFTGPARAQGAKFGDYLAKNTPVIKQLKLLGANQLTAGTAAPTIIRHVTNRLNQLIEQDITALRTGTGGGGLDEVLDKVGQKFGVRLTSLDPEDAPDIPGLKAYLRKTNVFMYATMSGDAVGQAYRKGSIAKAKYIENPNNSSQRVFLKTKEAAEIKRLADKGDQEGLDLLSERLGIDFKIDTNLRVKDVVADTAGDLPAGPRQYGVEIEDVDRGALDPTGAMREWLSQEGLLAHTVQARSILTGRYRQLFMNEAGEYDRGKIGRIYRSIRRKKDMTEDEIARVLDKEFDGPISDLINSEVMDKILKGEVSNGEFFNLVRQVRQLDDLDNYMPRNVHSTAEVGKEGIEVKRVMSTGSSRGYEKDKVSGRLREKSAADSVINPDDLEVIADHLDEVGQDSEELRDLIDRTRRNTQKRLPDAENQRVMYRDLDFTRSLNKYLHSTRKDVVLFAEEVPETVRAAIAASAPKRPKGQPSKRVSQEREALGESLFDVYQDTANVIRQEGDEATATYLEGPLFQRMTGELPLKDMMSYQTTLAAQKVIQSFADSKFMDKVAGVNDTARNFVGSLRSFARKDITEVEGSKVGRFVAGGFYASHLGFNLGSVALNLFQPLMFAQTWMGADNLARGYGQAIKQYFGYARERAKLPLARNLSASEADEVLALRRKHFRLSDVEGEDLLDINQSAIETLDNVAFTGTSDARRGGRASFYLSDLPLKMFQHAEIFNRVAVGEAAFSAMRRARKGRGPSIRRVRTEDGALTNVLDVDGFKDKSSQEYLTGIEQGKDNIRQMVQNTQFGSDIMNSPELFQANSIFTAPWARQFFTFPIRTLTSYTDTTRLVAGGERTWGLLGATTTNPFLAIGHDTARLLGTSAIAYEVMKNMFGMDVSRGLAAETLFDSTIVGPYLTGDDRTFPAPPALDIIVEGTRAVLDSDKSLIGEVLPRFVPGGLALSKLSTVLPQIASPKSPLSGIQNQYADWSNINDKGEVPIYRADGSLLEFRSAPSLILGSLGLSSYMFQDEQEMTKFLIKNRQASVDFRRRYLDAMFANNFEMAQKVKREYETKFQQPLSVSKQQIDRGIRLREVPLRERMLTQFPRELRPQFAGPLVSVGGLKSQTPEEALLSEAEKVRLQPSTFNRPSGIEELLNQ
jgi:hypothetical protein